MSVCNVEEVSGCDKLILTPNLSSYLFPRKKHITLRCDMLLLSEYYTPTITTQIFSGGGG